MVSHQKYWTKGECYKLANNQFLPTTQRFLLRKEWVFQWHIICGLKLWLPVSHILIIPMYFGLKILMLCPYPSKKALRIFSFQLQDCHSSPLFKNTVYLNILSSIFDNWFTLCSDIHSYNTAACSTDKLLSPSSWTNLYGKNSVTLGAVNVWNKIQAAFGNVILKNLTSIQIKTFKKYIVKYWQIFVSQF